MSVENSEDQSTGSQQQPFVEKHQNVFPSNPVNLDSCLTSTANSDFINSSQLIDKIDSHSSIKDDKDPFCKHSLNLATSLTANNLSSYKNNNSISVNYSLKKDVQLDEDDCVLDLSTHQNSVLLSPAPSSLGSSREELANDSTRVSSLYQTRLWGLPWPPPAWHCFQSGKFITI